MKTREEWEKELRDRQRNNYVFPGTVINQTAMYRSLLRGPTHPNRFLRVSMFVIGFAQIFMATYFVAVAVNELVRGADAAGRISAISMVIIVPLLYLLGIKMVVRAVFPAPKVTTPRK